MSKPPFSFSHIRHDLRTPLNHILGYSELLLEDADSDGLVQVSDHLGKIHDHGISLVGIISQHLSNEQQSALTHEKLTELLPLFRTPCIDILARVDSAIKYIADSGDQQWQSDLQKIEKAAHLWLELVEKYLQPGKQKRLRAPAKVSSGKSSRQ